LNTPSRVKHASSVHRMLCKKSSSAACWCHNHSQNCICGGRSSGNRCALRELWYGCNWLSLSTSRTLGCDSPNFRAISRELLHGSCSTAAIMASSLAGVRTVCGRPAFTSAVGVTLPASRRRCSNRRSTLA
jgi:hypothetical protein